jgi:hypothetical protein
MAVMFIIPFIRTLCYVGVSEHWMATYTPEERHRKVKDNGDYSNYNEPF